MGLFSRLIFMGLRELSRPTRSAPPKRAKTVVVTSQHSVETTRHRARRVSQTSVVVTDSIPAQPQQPLPDRIVGPAWVVDGDTIVINKTSIRLFGIDAPEMDHPFGVKSKYAMVGLCKGQTVTAVPVPGAFSYERCVARCYLPDGRDLSAELVKLGLAVDWPKFSGGEYRHLEVEGVRKKLWRAHNRQVGGSIPPARPRAAQVRKPGA